MRRCWFNFLRAPSYAVFTPLRNAAFRNPHFFADGVCDRRSAKKMRRVLFAAAVAAVAGFATLPPGAKDDAPTFNRVASFYVCTQLDPTCNTDTETVAEIVAVTEDGYTAVYTDSPQDVRRSRCPTAFLRAFPDPARGQFCPRQPYPSGQPTRATTPTARPPTPPDRR